MCFSLTLFLLFPLKQNKWLVIATVTKKSSMISSLQGWLTADNATKCRFMDSCLLKNLFARIWDWCVCLQICTIACVYMHMCLQVQTHRCTRARGDLKLKSHVLLRHYGWAWNLQISANLAGKFALGLPCLCLLSSEVIDSWYACLTFARVLGIWTIHGAFLSILRKLFEETFFQGPCHSG